MMTLQRISPGPVLAVAQALILTACASLERAVPPSEPEVAGDSAPAHVPGWVETDAVVTLDHRALEAQLQSALIGLRSTEDFEFRDVELDFSGQAIALQITADLDGGDQEPYEALLHGDVTLSYSGAGLKWYPEIDRLAPGVPVEDPWANQWLERINSALIRELVVARRNSLGFRLQPPREIALSASLPGVAEDAGEFRFPLDGAFTVAASAVRVGESTTTIALDLEFVDSLSHCTADFSISRSTFAGRVVDREPRDIGRRLSAGSPELHYFTEVTDARRNLTLVPYWFADGRAVGIAELPVEPSARWRTWSSLPVTPGTARHVEVFAADRDSGCIVDAGHIELALGVAGEDRVASPGGFAEITRTFPAAGEYAGMGVAELSAGYWAEALNRSLANEEFSLRFEVEKGRTRPFSGSIDSLAGAQFDCQWRDCSVRTECRVDFSRCERKQDTRECNTCLFRNPLNNRCMSEQIDADCEDEKVRANAKYESAWEACLVREQSALEACEQQEQEAVESCTQRGEIYLAACEANRGMLNARTDPVADIEGQARAGGAVTLSFSGLHVVGDLARLKGLLRVVPDLTVDGRLQFSPHNGLGDLGSCISGWDAEFRARADRFQPPRRLSGTLGHTADGLSAAWPGMTVPLNMNRGPLEALLSSNTSMLSACGLGLSPGQLGARTAGEDGFYLRGVMPLDVEAGTARIAMPAVSAWLGGIEYEADASFVGAHLRYELDPGAEAKESGAALMPNRSR